MDPRIKVCQVINRFMMGGAETVALDLSRRLDPARYEVRALAMLRPLDGSGHADMERRFRDAGVVTDSLGLDSFRNPLSLWKLYRYFRRHRFDIVHGHNRGSDAWAVEIGALAGVSHRYWTRHLVYKDMTPAMVRRYARLSRKSDRVFAVSDAVRHNCIEVEGIAPNKVVTLVNGIDTERFAPLPDDDVASMRANLGLEPGDRMLLYVARMNEQKAPEGFIQLVWCLRERGLQVRGFMCGTGPLEAEVRALVDDGPGGVEILGVRNDIPELLASTDLFVSTSRNEGLPLNVMEAMSCGAAFVAPDIDQISCLLEGSPLHGMCLYEAPSDGELPRVLIEGWADKVSAVIDDADWRRTVGTSAREILCASYSLERMVRAYQDAYETALSADSRRGA